MSSPPTFGITSAGQSDFERIGQYEGTNPVIAIGNSSQSDYRIREIGNILYEPADTGREYKIWYTGYRLGVTTDEKIHHAYSSDGKSWTKSTSNPVISDRRAEDPYIVKSGSTYYLYAEDKEAAGAGEADMVRRWHSSDGETWVDDGQITGLTNVQSPVVWIEGAVWYMLYENYPTAPLDIRLATSSDGLAWTAEASNPVFSESDCDWGGTVVTVVPDDILKIDGVYYMLYHASVSGIFEEGIASSSDLLTWTDGTHNPLWTDESAARVPNTVSFLNEDVLYYYAQDHTGIYRGYPLKRL